MNIAAPQCIRTMAAQIRATLKRLDKLQSAQDTGLVRLSPPRVSIAAAIEMLGPRVFLGHWPSSRVSILSSRLPRRKDHVPWWFDALRTAAIRSADDGAALVSVPGTTSAPFLQRLCELFGLPCLPINLPEQKTMAPDSVANWLETNSLPTKAITVSPQIELPGFAPDQALIRLPLQDRTLALCGTRLISLHTVTNGNCHQLLKHQLFSGKPIMLPAVRGRKPAQQAVRSLIQKGAHRWILEPLSAKPLVSGALLPAPVASDRTPVSHPARWLCHWTRPHHGPWSDQCEHDYLDELLLASPTADRSAQASLIQIVHHQKIIAASLSAACSAVSWTAVPLTDFRKRRVFRPHKQHFDFEPWGIAVRRQWLVQNGCQPVRYIARSSAASPGPAWLEHPATSRDGKIDWREEQEWRSSHAVDLSAAPSNHIIVFVDRLSMVSRRLINLVRLRGWAFVEIPG